MDSINKTSKIVVIIAVILFVVIVVGFVVGMFAMYKDMISDFEPDSGENWELYGVYMDVPNIENIGDRIPDINYAYASEGEVTYALSDELMELDPAAKAVPFSQFSNYYEFNRSVDNIKINYSVYAKREFKGTYLNFWAMLFFQKVSKYHYFVDLDPIGSSDDLFYKNLPAFDNGYNFSYNYNDILRYFSKTSSSNYNNYLYGDLSLISRGSGCILKLVNDETGEFVYQGGYDLSKVLLNEVIYDLSNHVYVTPVRDESGEIIDYVDQDGRSTPNKYNCLSLFYGEPVTGMRISDRGLWDQNGQFSDYDSAYFYSYGDSYFELIADIGVPYFFDGQVDGYNEFFTYTRFRVY